MRQKLGQIGGIGVKVWGNLGDGGINFRNLGEIRGILVKNEAEIGANLGNLGEFWLKTRQKLGQIWGIWGNFGVKLGHLKALGTTEEFWGKFGGF